MVMQKKTQGGVLCVIKSVIFHFVLQLHTTKPCGFSDHMMEITAAVEHLLFLQCF